MMIGRVDFDKLKDSKRLLVIVVYLSLFLDNILLTVVVPIVPDYLYYMEKQDVITDSHQLEKNENNFKLPQLGPPTTEFSIKVHKPDSEITSQTIYKISKKEKLMKDNFIMKKLNRRSITEAFRNEKIRNISENILMSTNISRLFLSGVKKSTTKNKDVYDKVKDQTKDILVGEKSKKTKVRTKEEKSGLITSNNPDKKKDDGQNSLKTSLVLVKSGHLQAMLPGNCSNVKANFDIYSLVPQIQNLSVSERFSQTQNSPSTETKTTQTSFVLNPTPTAPAIIKPSPKRPGSKPEPSKDDLNDENGRVGILLASKALVQLIMNPIVGALTSRVGYHLPLFIGNANLLVAALLFAFGESYATLLLARSLQGVASACIGVSGMCLVAEQYPEEGPRSKVMGVVLGSIALGVLLGYPFGGFVYDFVGKSAPFIVIAVLVALNGVLQLIFLDLKTRNSRAVVNISWSTLLSDGMVLLTSGAILLSTSAMAILEPCLPIWLMDNLKPHKWQLGTVFIPDSIGYLLGTNCFGMIAYRFGRWRVAILAMMLVGLSTVLVPSASAVSQLAVPHFCLGLGIGVVDAALVPLLANLVDMRYSAHYGAVYALQQTAVSLAYFLGPLAGGELVRAVGFPWLMRSVGLLNLMYCPLLVLIGQQSRNQPINTQVTSLVSSGPHVTYQTTVTEVTEVSKDLQDSTILYKRFMNSDDSD